VLRTLDVILTEEQRSELTSISQSRSLPAGYVFRANLILLLSESVPFSGIRNRLKTTTPTIVRWKQRFLKDGIGGLDTAHPGLMWISWFCGHFETTSARKATKSLLVWRAAVLPCTFPVLVSSAA